MQEDRTHGSDNSDEARLRGQQDYNSSFAAECEADRAVCVVVAERIKTIVTKPFFIENKEIFITASIGLVSSTDGETRSSNDFIRDADIAMYSAKNNGRKGGGR